LVPEGGSQEAKKNASAFSAASSDMLKYRAAARALMPSAQAKRTFRYNSTVWIYPPSLEPQKGKSGRILHNRKVRAAVTGP
jgi:hypothetical protein